MTTTERINAQIIINERFEILHEIGRGGFAVVYEGVDLRLGRQVAVKVLRKAHCKQERLVERFMREASLAASVNHPSIVSIYDVGFINESDKPFIVMEYLKGRSLQAQLDQHGPMSPDKLIPHFIEVLKGLGAAHEAGIVHKDLKPDNIFYRHPDTQLESLCIVDFGIAHIGHSQSQRATRVGEFFGTPSYMAPEYITDQIVSPAIDIYQMGLILLECLIGKPLIFHAEPVAALLIHLHGNYKVPRPIKQSPLWPVAKRALSIDPAQRYASAFEFAAALAAVPLDEIPMRIIAPPHQAVQDSLVTPMHTWVGHGRGALLKLDEIAAFSKEEDIEDPSSVDDWSFQRNPQPRSLNLESAVILGPGGQAEERASAHQLMTPAPVQQPTMTPPPLAPAPLAPLATDEHVQTLAGKISPPHRVLMGLIALIAAAILVISFIALHRSLDRSSGSSAALTSALSASAPGPVTLPSSPPEPTSRAQRPAVTQPSAAQASPAIKRLIVSEPAQAEVFDGLTLLGKTPLELTFEAPDAPSRELVLKMDGYQDLDLLVTTEHEPSAHKLKAIKKRERSRPSSRSAKPAPEDAPTILLPPD